MIGFFNPESFKQAETIGGLHREYVWGRVKYEEVKTRLPSEDLPNYDDDVDRSSPLSMEKLNLTHSSGATEIIEMSGGQEEEQDGESLSANLSVTDVAGLVEDSPDEPGTASTSAEIMANLKILAEFRKKHFPGQGKRGARIEVVERVECPLVFNGEECNVEYLRREFFKHLGRSHSQLVQLMSDKDREEWFGGSIVGRKLLQRALRPLDNDEN